MLQVGVDTPNCYHNIPRDAIGSGERRRASCVCRVPHHLQGAGSTEASLASKTKVMVSYHHNALEPYRTLGALRLCTAQ
jgi:hypothetical protein